MLVAGSFLMIALLSSSSGLLLTENNYGKLQERVTQFEIQNQKLETQNQKLETQNQKLEIQNQQLADVLSRVLIASYKQTSWNSEKQHVVRRQAIEEGGDPGTGGSIPISDLLALLQCDDGEDGEDGVDGSPGISGAPGLNGLPGTKGEPGNIGPKGCDGASGAVGPAGNPGAKGEIGLPGSKGFPGVTGSNGIQGVKGDTGIGATGPIGAKGAKGDPGNSGLPGPGIVQPESVTCPGSYTRNPISNTCIRLVRSHKNWSEAKSYCESAGEYLATFETIESASWLRTQMYIGSSWRLEAYIGGQRSGNKWYWQGRITGQVTYSYWGPREPSHGGEYCMASTCSHDCYWNDISCSARYFFFCEKVVTN